MKAFRKVLDKVLSSVCAILFAIMTALTTYQVLTRYLFKAPSTWSEELVGYMFAWMALLGAAYVFGKRDHMNIPVVVERFAPKTQVMIAILGEILTLLFMALVLVYGGFAFTKLGMGQTTASLGIKVGTMYAVIPVTGIITVLYNIMNIADLAGYLDNPDAFVKKED